MSSRSTFSSKPDAFNFSNAATACGDHTMQLLCLVDDAGDSGKMETGSEMPRRDVIASSTETRGMPALGKLESQCNFHPC